VITGPECTGKTTLADQLATHFNTRYFPEYARDYVAHLGIHYVYDDLVRIAEVQLKQAHEDAEKVDGLVFLDTYLVITKIWFKVVYGQYPEWIDRELSQKTIDLYLLCNTELPWIADPVRENGGEMREKLFLMYKNELDKFGCRYEVVTGTGSQRLYNAIEAVNRLLIIEGREELIKS
jgi:NadR type nicotinamide-nucleotide adenylyltransferase